MSTFENLRDVHLEPTFYASSRNDLIREFYVPCLRAANRYDRAVGYFRSSILAVAGLPFTDFAQRGGKARFLCSPEMTQADADAINNGYQLRGVADTALRREMHRMLEYPVGEEALRVLATLVALGHVDFKVVIKRGGIFHHKIGIFSDQSGAAVSFIGSTNESWSGWSPSGNDESFEVFTSWGPDEDRVKRHTEFFDSLWTGSEDGVDVLELPDAFKTELLQFQDPAGRLDSARVVFASVPERPTLFEHQELALEDWARNGKRGILEHATGSGKTITALEAIRRWLEDGQPALVIVPSELLLKQWIAESRKFLAEIDPGILVAGGNHPRKQWEDNLSAFSARGQTGNLIIATIQTAVDPIFLQRVKSESLLVVIDEAHRAGSPIFQGVLTIDAPARLGLTATPVRANDPQGTHAIKQYFARTILPRFTLRDAIKARRLTPYKYYVHTVALNHDEQEAWNKLTHEISVEIARNTDGGALPDTDKLKFLLIKRARIVKKAEMKTSVAAAVLQKHFTSGESWLVYCEDQEQLQEVMNALRSVSLPVYEYHSSMEGDRDATMSFFQQEGGILVAIRCLDEGVDIPRVSHAVILASSRNPREFIQRRGRVLRRFEGKYVASIHDVLVTPDPEANRAIEAQLVAPEIARAALFARDALNKATYLELEALASNLGLDIESMAEGGDEDDD